MTRYPRDLHGQDPTPPRPDRPSAASIIKAQGGGESRRRHGNAGAEPGRRHGKMTP